jgi:hypothetical protein
MPDIKETQQHFPATMGDSTILNHNKNVDTSGCAIVNPNNVKSYEDTIYNAESKVFETVKEQFNQLKNQLENEFSLERNVNALNKNIVHIVENMATLNEISTLNNKIDQIVNTVTQIQTLFNTSFENTKEIIEGSEKSICKQFQSVIVPHLSEAQDIEIKIDNPSSAKTLCGQIQTIDGKINSITSNLLAQITKIEYSHRNLAQTIINSLYQFENYITKCKIEQQYKNEMFDLFDSTLSNGGINRICPKNGEEYNPEIHQTRQGVKSGQFIKKTLLSGYIWNQQVIRSAIVDCQD